MKDTFYFTHDYNCRSDIKIKKLIRQHGPTGYGIYWMLIEDLYNNSNEMPTDYDGIAYELRCDINIIKSIINDFELFIVDDDTFGSLSVEKRLDQRSEKSKKAKENAFKRWGTAESRNKASEAIFYVLRIYGETEEFIKCGLTTESISRRYSGKLVNYKYEVLYQKEMGVSDSLSLENLIGENFKKYTPTDKFAGYLECYDICEKDSILNFAMLCECKGNAIKERKEKETKGNEIKETHGIAIDNVVSSSTDVGSSFEELIEVYPKVNSHKAETIALFNNLNDDEKKKCVTFAKQLQLIWKQNGIQDKYQFMKSCHTFVEDKMFNGKPKDIFPREVSTEVVNEYTKEELEWIEKNKNYKTPIERFREQQQKENI